MLRHLLTLGCFVALACSLGWAQVINVTADQATPTPGVGHDYIKMLTETVDPATGSVSIRIGVPMPKGRGLTLPFAFAYDSNGFHYAFSEGEGIGIVGWASSSGAPYSKGGWSYSVPTVTTQYQTISYEVQQTPPTYSTCSYYTGYVFQDASGGRHALGLSDVLQPKSQGCTQNPYLQPFTISNGSDDFVQASIPANSNSGGPVSVVDAGGTLYQFSNSNGPSYTLSYAEDRNGNRINVGGSGYTDTLGRPVLSSSGFGSSGDTVSVSGLSAPYTLTWGSVGWNFSAGAVLLDQDSYCRGFGGASGTSSVVTAISLPNGQTYRFQYDGTYGLVNKIIYPSGGYVRYVWGMNPLSIQGGFQDGQNFPNAFCDYEYGEPAVLHRYVSFDGSTEVLQQDFSYSTSWAGSGRWTSKQTTVTTHDLLRPASFTTVYTYSSVVVSAPPNELVSTGTQIPLEQSVVYKDGSGHVLRTVNKSWYDQYELKSEQTQLDNNLLSETDYTYGSGAQVTEKDEYDYGSGARGPLLRKTIINYASFAATPIYPSPSIFDRPSSIISYDGSGTRVAETDYAYDDPGLVPAEITVGRDAGYNGNTSVPRGNATRKMQWLNTTGADLTTKYTYDDTGQMRSMTDPNNNVTQYDYADSFPNGNTNAYLTKITYPVTHTDNPNHIESFTYNYADGQLSSSTDQNSQKTSYYYESSLGRLDEIDYPDQGQTTFGYDDAVPSVLTTKKLSISGSPGPYQSTTVMDGVGHVIQTQLNSDPDPAGEDYTDTTYDGEGRVWKQSNPHRSTSLPSDGTTTYNYDALGRVTLMIPPDGGQTSNNVATSYSGNCATVTDEQGKARKSCADGLGRTTQVFEDPSGLNYETDYQYDALDNLAKVTQGSQTRAFVYDSLSRLTSATNPESGTTTYTYDPNGNLISKVAPMPNQTGSATVTTTYQYDPLNRLTQRSYSDGTPTALFGYDQTSTTIGTTHFSVPYGIGRPSWTYVQYSNGAVQDSYNYDAMGRITGYYQCTPYNCGGTAWEVSYSYDLAGDVTSWTHPAGFTVYNTINTAGQVSGATTSYSPTDAAHPQNLIPAITYTPFGAIRTLQEGCAPSASCPTSQQALETYDYNNRLQPVRLQLGNTANSAADYCLVYNYYGGSGSPSSCVIPSQASGGNNGNVMGYLYLDNQTNLSPSLGHTASYLYDSLNRLTSAVATGNSTYNLTFVYNQDGSGRYGNMSCQTNGQTQGLCTNVSFNPANNQISAPGYSYDAAGNLTQDPTWMPTANYTWDAEGRLTKITQGSNTYSNNTFNAQGQEVEQVYPIFGNDTNELPFDPWGRELGHYDGKGNAWYDEDIWAAGRMFAQSFPSETYFLHHNALGSDVQLTNQSGTPTLDMAYYPLGQIWTHTGYESDAHYAGFQQAGGNLDATPTRQYANPLGRWLSPDPAGGHLFDPQTLNKYSYVRNNPVSLTDPTGLDFYLACNNSNHSSCTQVTINKTKYWVQSGANGNATIITSDSIRAGQNNAVVNGSGVQINGSNTGVYFDNPASHTTDANGHDVNNNPITLQGEASKGFGGFSFNINGNCGGTCLSSGSFQFAGTPEQARAALDAAGAWNYGIWDFFDSSRLPIVGHHPETDQFRFGSGPSSHFSVPIDYLFPPNVGKWMAIVNPKSTVPATGDFHVDATTGASHGLCANLGIGCSE